MSRAKTVEEVREEFLDMMRTYADYWANVQDRSTPEKLHGLCFSILNIFDGTTLGLPAFDIVVRPHEDEKQFAIDNGEDYYEDGMCINDDCYLHDMYYKEKTDGKQ